MTGTSWKRLATGGLAFTLATLGGCTTGGKSEVGGDPSYTVALDTADPTRLRVALDLPAGDGRLLVSRATAMQLESQVVDLRCDGAEVPSEPGGWRLPDGCRHATWTVMLDTPERGTVVPSDQRSILMPGGGVLLSGPTALPQLDRPGRVRLPGRAEARLLTALDAPPSFYVIGQAPRRPFERDGMRLAYVADDLDRVAAIVDPERHLDAIAYFRSILGDAAVRSADELTVVWFGAARERREASGAAGHDVLLANYVIPEDRPTPFERALPLVLVLHEQFHQMQAGPGAHPHWVSESLANYFALKAARTHLSRIEGVDEVWSFFIDTNAPVSMGLLEIQRRIDEAQDHSGYRDFYSVGAAFWAALDQALSDATGGRRTLDDVLPVIAASDFAPGEGLPQAVLEALSGIPPHELLRLVRRYLHGEET